MALQLRRAGIRRVRPLEGGIKLWMEREYPVEGLMVESEVK